MPAKTVERKFLDALQDVYIGSSLLHNGTDFVPVGERLDWIDARLQEAREYHKKVEKKRERQERKS